MRGFLERKFLEPRINWYQSKGSNKEFVLVLEFVLGLEFILVLEFVLDPEIRYCSLTTRLGLYSLLSSKP